MPWSSLKNVPKRYKKTFKRKGYSAKQKRAWLKTFNSAHRRYGQEGRAFATAWSVANNLKETFKEWLINQEQQQSR